MQSMPQQAYVRCCRFPCVLEAVALTIPTKQFIEILLMYTDDKIHEIEQAEKTKSFWNKFKKTK